MKNMINLKTTLKHHGITRIQPQAIDELHSYLMIALEKMGPQLQHLAHQKGRATIYTEDIIDYFGFPIHDIENLKQYLYEQQMEEDT